MVVDLSFYPKYVTSLIALCLVHNLSVSDFFIFIAASSIALEIYLLKGACWISDADTVNIYFEDCIPVPPLTSYPHLKNNTIGLFFLFIGVFFISSPSVLFLCLFF